MPFKWSGQGECLLEMGIQRRGLKTAGYTLVPQSFFLHHITLCICFIFFPVLVTVWNHFLLALYLPLACRLSYGVEARVLVSRHHAQPHAPSESSSPWLRVSALLWLSLIFIVDEALSSFLQGQAAWGSCRQPACGCLSPVSISGSLSTELTEVAGPLYSIPEQTLWPGRAHESSPWKC